jgi:hypothetical protein
VPRIRFATQEQTLKRKTIFLKNCNSFLLCVVFVSCVNHPIDRSIDPANTSPAVNSLSETYREIALTAVEQSLYMSSQWRQNRFVKCLYSNWNNNRYISEDSDSMSMVNSLLNICLPEDKKVKYLSPQWFESHNACFLDFIEITGGPIQTKEKIQIPYRIIKKINAGYMAWEDVDSFSTSNLVEVLDKFKKAGIETIILDMRNNVGGSIYDMNAFLRLVLRARGDPYFTILKSRKRIDEYVVKTDGLYSNFKWVVMVNNKSASATEVIAGVLKRQGAIIMGEPTYGKGTVQERWILFDVGDKRCPGLLKLTARQIFFDDGTSPEGTGIKPDIVVTDSDNALLKPIEYLTRQMVQRQEK